MSLYGRHVVPICRSFACNVEYWKHNSGCALGDFGLALGLRFGVRAEGALEAVGLS